jgi:hypothetical protein
MTEAPDPLTSVAAGGNPEESRIMNRSRPEESDPALIAPETMVYIMLGAFMAACGGIRIAYETAQPFPSRGAFYVYSALVVIGIAFIAIGLGIGRMALRTRSAADKPRGGDEDRSIDGKKI